MSMDSLPSGSEKSPLIKPLIQDGIFINEPPVDPGCQAVTKDVIPTFFNFVKASIGSGSFALPFAVLSAGVIVGSIGMVLLGIVSLYTMQLMLECKNKAVRGMAPQDKEEFNYTQLGKRAFDRLQIGSVKLGFIGKWAVDLSVLGCNLGVCAGYMIFIASNLRYAFTCFAYHHETNSGFCFTTWELYAMIIPILILLTYLPSFKYLAFAAYVGAVFLIVAVITVLVYGRKGFHYDDDHHHVQWGPTSWEGIAQWFGITAFLFCVHSMVIPLESAMKYPKYMKYVLDAAAIAVVGINLPFALYGYFLFGSDTKGYIFENLPGGIFNDIVRVCLSLELTLTFPIVFKPASDVMEEIVSSFLLWISRNYEIYSISELFGKRELKWKIAHYVMICFMRTLLVLVSWGVAIGIPRFELCLAFVGSLATTILAFILPPIFHMLLLWSDTHIIRNILHCVILGVGVIATILATGINLYEAIANPGTAATCSSIQSDCVASTSNGTTNSTMFIY